MHQTSGDSNATFLSLSSLRILNHIGASILSEQSTEEITETVYHHVNQLMDAYSFAIGILNTKTKNLEYTGARENDRKLPPFSVDAYGPERFSGWVIANRKEILINDYEQEYALYLPRTIQPLQGIHPASLMYVPIFLNDEITGIISVRTPMKNAYTAQSMEILKTMAVFIGKAIENARLRKQNQGSRLPVPKHYENDPLSARELEVLSLLAKGFTNKAIAGSLFISPSTVKTHTLNIYQKLEVTSRTEAISKARQYGILM